MFPFKTKPKTRSVKETKSKTLGPLQDAYTLKSKIDAIQSSKKTFNTSEIIQIQSKLLTSAWQWISTYGVEYITKYEKMKKTLSNYNELIKLITTANTNILNINHYTKQNTQQLKNITQKIDRNNLRFMSNYSQYPSPQSRSKRTSNSCFCTNETTIISNTASVMEEPEIENIDDEENKSESESSFSAANIETSEENIMSDVGGFEISMNNSIMELQCHALSSITLDDDHTCIAPQISEHDNLMPIYEITESPSNIYTDTSSSTMDDANDDISFLFPSTGKTNSKGKTDVVVSPQPSPNTYISNVVRELSNIPSLDLKNKSYEKSTSLSPAENLVIDEILEKMFALEVINHSFLKFIRNGVQQCLIFNKTKIHATFHTLRDILNQRELQLINELKFMHKSKLSLIQRQQKSLLNYKLFLKTNLIECEKVKLEYKNKWKVEYKKIFKFLNVKNIGGSSFDSPLIYHGLLEHAHTKKRNSANNIISNTLFGAPITSCASLNNLMPNKKLSQIKRTLIKERQKKMLNILKNINFSFSLKTIEADVQRLRKMYAHIIANGELNDVQNKLKTFGKLIDFYEKGRKKIFHKSSNNNVNEPTNSLGYKISKIFKGSRKQIADTRDSILVMKSRSPVVSNMRLDNQGLITNIHSESDEEEVQKTGKQRKVSVESIGNIVIVKNKDLVALAAISNVDINAGVKVLSVASSLP